MSRFAFVLLLVICIFLDDSDAWRRRRRRRRRAPPPPVHGGYSSWSGFTPCTKPCNTGTHQRQRHCNSPSPAHGGLGCGRLGAAVEVRHCNVHPCPINGGYSSWTEYTPCSKSCGPGSQSRSRTCSNPPRAHGGADCTRLGAPVEVRECLLKDCPPPCINQFGNCEKHKRFCSSSSMKKYCPKTCGACPKY